MNEFEKWWDKKHPRTREFDGTEQLKIAAKEGWKAALEWALKLKCYDVGDRETWMGDEFGEL